MGIVTKQVAYRNHERTMWGYVDKLKYSLHEMILL